MIVAGLVAVALVVAAQLSEAADVDTISHGSPVDLRAHLVPDKLTLFDFYAEWCQSCAALAPELERLADDNPDQLALRKIDVVSWESEVTRQFSISSLPHLKLYDQQGALLAQGGTENVLGELRRRLPDQRGTTTRRGVGAVIIVVLLTMTVAALLAARQRRRSDANDVDERVTRASPPAAAQQWFVQGHQALEGPYDLDKLEELCRRSLLPRTAKIRRAESEKWQTLQQVLDES